MELLRETPNGLSANVTLASGDRKSQYYPCVSPISAPDAPSGFTRARVCAWPMVGMKTRLLARVAALLCALSNAAELKVEEDRDLHIALHDATGEKAGVVVCKVLQNRGEAAFPIAIASISSAVAALVFLNAPALDTHHTRRRRIAVLCN